MMAWLFYKSWLESRWRFAICLGLVAFVFGADIYQAGLNMKYMGMQPLEFHEYVWKIYFTRFHILWIISTLVLSMGGLVSERLTGASDFSLSLPVSRRRWQAIRSAMAAAQALVLAFAPVAVIPAVAAMTGRSYPLFEAARFSLIIFLTGLFLLAFGLLYSSCFSGQYASVALGIATVFALAVIVNPLIGRYPFLSMNPVRESSLNPSFFLDSEHWPVTDVLIRLAAAAVLWELATRILEKRDF